MYYLGIDIGSLSCDAVLIDHSERIIASSVVPTGARNREAIERVTEDVLRSAGISHEDITSIVSTGYGRNRVEKRDSAVTEITCHGRGVMAQKDGIDLLIDIGGQDSKAILFDENGAIKDFAMNDKCAAGTGRFLEAMARVLQVDINEISRLDAGAKGSVTLSSMCTVFAESEVVSLIAEGIEVNEIVRGLNKAIASRTVSMVKRLARNTSELSAAMSGGVARNSGVVRAISEAMGCGIFVPPEPDTIGALGAALIAKEKSKKMSA